MIELIKINKISDRLGVAQALAQHADPNHSVNYHDCGPASMLYLAVRKLATSAAAATCNIDVVDPTGINPCTFFANYSG